jgi:ATP/maltotriose-dependent transcriptional regulator MalT
LTDLAVLAAKQGRMDEAEPLLGRAQAIVEASRGPEYPTIAVILIERAKIQLLRGETEEARASCKRALQIARDAWGPEHPTVLEAEALYASVSPEPAATADHGAG